MKAWGSGGTFKTHMQGSSTALATAFKIIRHDLQVFGFTTSDVSCTIDGVIYRSFAGGDSTAAHSTDDASVDTLDVSFLLDVSTEREIHGGVWDGAETLVAEYVWSNPPLVLDATTSNILRYGNLGNVTCQQGVAKAEVRGLIQKLSTRLGIIASTICPWRHARWDVGSQTYVSSAECGADLAGLGFIQTGTLTGIDPNDVTRVQDTGNAQPEQYYSSGFLTITDGENANITRAVRRWQGKYFSLWMPFPFEITGGEVYSAVRGDDHTGNTCQNVYNNKVHFLGLEYVPGSYAAFAAPVRS